MAKVVTTYGNFSKGKIDHDMMGRFDLPIYSTGMDIFENFVSNFKGNAIFSSGFLSQIAFQDAAFIEFKFGITQNYLCVFYNAAVQFLAFDTNGVFGWVLSGGVPLVVVSPYTLADVKQISFKGGYTQNNDVMVLTHRSYAPYKLTRTSATAFTLATFVRISDPFCDPSLSVSDTSVTSNTISVGSKTFTVTAGKTYVVGQPIRIQADAFNYMTGTVTSYTGTTLIVNITNIAGGNTFVSWTITMTATGWPGCCLFYKGRLYYASTSAKLTSMWFSNSGIYDDFTIQTVLTDASGFAFTVADITQQIEWMFPGDNSLIVGATDGIVAVNGGAVNTAITAATVQANITSAEPTNGSYPFKKDGLIFYIGRTGRNIYFFKYNILTETFLSQDANLVAYDITIGNLSKLRYKHDRNDLIFSVRGDGDLTSLCFKEDEKINGWHERDTLGTFTDIAVMADNNGNPQLFVLVNRNGTVYIEQQAPYVEFAKRADFWTPSDNPQNEHEQEDDEAYNRYVSEQLRQCVYLDNAIKFSDLRATTITFTQSGTDPASGKPLGTLGSSGADFLVGDVGKHVVYKTLTGYESGRYIITGYNAANNVNVTVLQDPKTVADAQLYVWSSWYKSFLTISGIAQFNGQTIGAVTDGGFLDNFSVSGGTITFNSQVTSVVLGYRYTGIIKSMCLGFQFQGANTQMTLKNIVRAGLRCVNSAGLRFGSSLYDLQDVQERSQNDINYLPPKPIDGTKFVDYTDDSEEDKFFYIVQDQPLPGQVANFMLEANYSASS